MLGRRDTAAVCVCHASNFSEIYMLAQVCVCVFVCGEVRGVWLGVRAMKTHRCTRFNRRQLFLC